MVANERSRAAKRRASYTPYIVAGFALLLFGVGFAYVSGFAEAAGYQIPNDDIGKDYLLGAVWAICLAVLIAVAPLIAEDRLPLLVGWLAKCLTTLLFMLPYEKRYELDCFSYFYSMKWPVFEFELASAARARLAVIGVGWYQVKVIDSYHAVKLTFAFIGLAAIYLIYRAGMSVIGQRFHAGALLALALFPSILFWSSIIGKDPIVFLGVASYVYGVAKWRETSNPRFIVILSAGIALATLMRVWLGLILGLPLVYFAIRGVRGFFPKLISATASVAILVIVFMRFTGSWDIENADDLVAVTDRISRQFSGSTTGAAGSTRAIGIEFTSIPLMIAFAPIGLMSVLFRPLPGEVRNIFGLLSGFENLALLYMTYRAFRAITRFTAIRRALMREPLIVWALLLIVTWTSMYGFIAFQNLGASVRFRLPIIAVFVAVLICVEWLNRSVLAQKRSASLTNTRPAQSDPPTTVTPAIPPSGPQAPLPVDGNA